MSTSGSKSNEHVAHFLVDIHILDISESSFMHIILHRIHFKNFVRLLDYHQPLVYRLRPLVG